MAKTARLEVRVEQALLTQVRREAGARGQKVATFVERALESALDETSHRSPEALAALKKAWDSPGLLNQFTESGEAPSGLNAETHPKPSGTSSPVARGRAPERSEEEPTASVPAPSRTSAKPARAPAGCPECGAVGRMHQRGCSKGEP